MTKTTDLRLRRLLVGVTVLAVLLPAASAQAALGFREVGRQSGIYHRRTTSYGAAWGDYDVDGDADLFLGRHSRPPRFHVNDRGRFGLTDDADFYPALVDRHACAWGEANGDARPDLYCMRGADRGKGAGANQLLIQDERGFDNRAQRFGVQDKFGRGRTVNWIDYDGDDDLDLYLANAIRRGHPNAMFRNDRGRFERVTVGVEHELQSISGTWADWDRDGDFDLLVNQYRPNPPIAYENTEDGFRPTQLGGVTERWWSSAAWGDYDGDGWPDLHLMNGGLSYVFRNNKGTFTATYKGRSRRGRSSLWFDVENDGDLDVFVVNGGNRYQFKNHPDVLLIQDADGNFVRRALDSVRGSRRGNGDSAAAADYDRDGRTDILVTNGFGFARGKSQLFRNVSDQNNWIAVRLHGGAWNPWGMGAEVEVVSTAGIYRRQITDGVTYRGQSDVGRMVLGIGISPVADVRVKWPDGEADCALVRASETIRIRKGRRGCLLE